MLLVACACPSFEEMEVVDRVGSDEAVADAEFAIRYFARWTGDAGVCVPELRIVDDVREPAWLEETHGRYRGRNAPIEIDVDAQWVWMTARHELCHAIDTIEGHSASNAELFPDRDASADYPERLRDGENFALECARGPQDTTIDSALAEACGVEPIHTDADRYLMDEVFDAVPRLPVGADRVPLTTVELPWTLGTGAEYATVHDAVAADGAVAVLLWEADYDEKLASVDSYGAWIHRYDSTLTRILSRAPAPVVYDGSTTEFVRSDTGLYLKAGSAYHEVRGRFLRRLDIPYVRGEHAISGGVLYAAGDGEPLRAWTLEGDELAVEPTPDWFGRSFDPRQLWPSEGGVRLLEDALLGSYDLSTGAWSVEPAPLDAEGWVDLPDGRGLVPVASPWQVLWTWDAGEWRPAGDPCQDVFDGSPPNLLVIDDRVLALGPSLPITEISVGTP